MATIPEEVGALLERLPLSDQQRVLNYARRLVNIPAFPHTPLPPGSPPDVLLGITLAPEVGEAIEQALDDCEQVDPDEE